MNDECIEKINKIYQSILGERASFDNDYSEEIDSLAYTELLIAFQNEFKIKFSAQEFFSLRSKENIQRSLIDKLNDKI